MIFINENFEGDSDQISGRRGLSVIWLGLETKQMVVAWLACFA
jgi:hypothetical protein